MYQRMTRPMPPPPAGAAPAAAAAAAPQAAAAQPGAASKAAIVPMLEISIQRLEDIVEQETAALKGRKVIDLKGFNDRKSQALLELTRALRMLKGAGPDAALAARIGTLKAKLAANQAALRLHLEAVREIATALSDAIRHSESDGTYTPAISSVAGRS